MSNGSALLTRITGQRVLHFLVAPPFSLLSGGDGRARRLRGLSVLAVAVVALLVALGLSWVLGGVDAQDTTVQLVKNTGQSNASHSPFTANDLAIGQQFKTGLNPHGYPLDEVKIAFERSPAATRNLKVELRSSVGGIFGVYPGNKITDLTLSWFGVDDGDDDFHTRGVGNRVGSGRQLLGGFVLDRNRRCAEGENYRGRRRGQWWRCGVVDRGRF